MQRRDFLRATLSAAALAALPRRLRAAGAPAVAARPLVSLARGADPARLVRAALDGLGGLGRWVRPGAWVVLKPNASFANAPDWGNNTNPAVTRAVAQACREAGARRVTVIDFPLYRGAEALAENGTAAAVSDLAGVELRVLSAAHHFRPLTVAGGRVLREVAVAREVLDADLLINLPVAKAHDAVAASIGIKNLMGLIWDRAVFHTGLEINQALADLAGALRPGLTLVDLTCCMTSNGPKGPGEVERPEMLLASADPVAADAVALTKLRFGGRKFRPAQLRYLVQARAAGLGELDLEKIDLQSHDA